MLKSSACECLRELELAYPVSSLSAAWVKNGALVKTMEITFRQLYVYVQYFTVLIAIGSCQMTM